MMRMMKSGREVRARKELSLHQSDRRVATMNYE